jgi:tryptophanyl-tRNA synthetase
MWLLASVTPTGWVERTPSFKEKKRNQPDDVNLALLNYPVLQAADIAIYKASYVPVGKDQAAHLELAREIVRAYNARYGETFPEPAAVFSEAPIVKGTDGANKMSKSLGNVIEIFADEDTIRRQVMSMVTDTQRQRRNDPGRPEVCNVCQLHRIFSPADYEAIWEGERSATSGCVDTKKLLAERILATFAEARERYQEFSARPGLVEEILRAGAERLAPLAAATLAECHERMGLASRS